MRKVALSTSIFEEKNILYLTRENVSCVEISSHGYGALTNILNTLRLEDIEVIGVHGPAPNFGTHPNLGSEEEFEESCNLIKGSFITALAMGSKSVTIHPFYDLKRELSLPKSDEEKFAFLRNLERKYPSLEYYLKSDDYKHAKETAIKNLRKVFYRLDQEFPKDIILCLENLNPRISYGLQKLSEFIEIYEGVGSSRLRLDLDLPHAHLSSKVYDFNLFEEIEKVNPFIGVVSISQNHGGKYCVDRRFNEKKPRENLQDIDPHFPVHGKVRKIRHISKKEIMSENLAFMKILRRAVMFDENGDLKIGDVPIKGCLKRVNPGIDIVLEYDNRYAPMPFLIKSYQKFQKEISQL